MLNVNNTGKFLNSMERQKQGFPWRRGKGYWYNAHYIIPITDSNGREVGEIKASGYKGIPGIPHYCQYDIDRIEANADRVIEASQ